MVCELYLLTNAGGQAGQKQTNKKAVLSPRPHIVLYTLCNRTNRTYPEGGDLEPRPQAQAPLAPIRRPKAGGEWRESSNIQDVPACAGSVPASTATRGSSRALSASPPPPHPVHFPLPRPESTCIPSEHPLKSPSGLPFTAYGPRPMSLILAPQSSALWDSAPPSIMNGIVYPGNIQQNVNVTIFGNRIFADPN